MKTEAIDRILIFNSYGLNSPQIASLLLNGETALDENEAYWAGLIVATAMLGSGLSLLLFPVFMGYGAVIMSLGIMTMIVVLMTKALIIQIQKWMDYNARIEETVANILALRSEVVPSQSKPKALRPRSNESKAEKPETEADEEVKIAAA